MKWIATNHESLLQAITAKRSPTRFAAAIALGYLAASALWIFTSDHIAVLLSSSEQELAAIQQVKGLAFVFASAVLLFFFARFLFRYAAREAQAVLRAREALLDLERSAIAGIILQSVVHDFRNHTQVAWGNLQVMGQDLSHLPQAQQDLLERIRHSVSQLIETLERNQVAGARTFARTPAPIDLAAYVAVCVELLRRHPKVAECTVRMAGPEGMAFTGYKALIHDALTNLVINAAEALSGRGTIEVRLSALPDGAEIEVHDSGPGIPEGLRQQIFQAFYTSKPAGTGLGLLSVKTCAEMHRGRATVARSPLGGACFRLDLHNVGLSAADPAAPSPRSPVTRPGSG